MKRKTFIVILFIMAIIAVLIYTDVKSQEDSLITYSRIQPSTTPEPFELVDKNGNVFNSTNVQSKNFLALFVFSQKCPSCDSNIFFWEKLKKGFDNRVKFIGIILSGQEDLIRFKDIKRTNFEVYRVIDVNNYKNNFNIRFAQSCTIILKDNAVVYSHAGELPVDEYFKIKKIFSGGL